MWYLPESRPTRNVFKKTLHKYYIRQGAEWHSFVGISSEFQYFFGFLVRPRRFVKVRVLSSTGHVPVAVTLCTPPLPPRVLILRNLSHTAFGSNPEASQHSLNVLQYARNTPLLNMGARAPHKAP